MAQVAIIGRPNVGKSTLFNRLAGGQKSIVEATQGVTRDRLEAHCSWSGRRFTLIDTGGLSSTASDSLEKEVLRQVDKAIEQADLILFVASVNDGLTQIDQGLARKFRELKLRKPIVLVVNKVDSSQKEIDAAEFHALGFGEPFLVSALHGRGVGELLDRIVEGLKKSTKKDAGTPLRLCMAGRPNVGKSSIVNALLGEPRVIVHEEPGTTRNSIDTLVSFQGHALTLIDTAGLRKRSKAKDSLEFYTRTRTVEAIRRSEVALLVLEAPQGVLTQDKRIAGEIEESGKGIIILANKWDKLAPKPTLYREFVRHVRAELYFVNYAPILAVSARTGEGIDKIFPTALRLLEATQQRFQIADLKKVVEEAVFVSPPPTIQGRRTRFKTIFPVGTSPPTFVLRTNAPGRIPEFYLHYLEGKLREAFNLTGTPIRFKIEAIKARRKS